jgi:outer membrane receptor protein involved in Fe transport
MKSNLRSLKAALALLLAFGLTTPVLAQSVSATITGTVQDKSGAVLKDASVTAINQKTQVEYPTKSNQSGVYTIQGLPLGTYTIKADAPGMKSLQTNPITLEVGQTARVNLPLEVGAKTEEIEVVGVNPVLQTENATVGEVVTASTIVALPLNGRNFAQLALLSPGVQTHSPDTFNSPKQSSDSGRPYVNGQREQSNNFMLDGVDQNEAVDNLIAYYPSPDALAEMRIETNNYSAEFGNVAGGVITAITKSGTNEFHGSAFEFARNDKFDANSWGNNRAGAGKANLSQSIFGGTVGGALIKNKLFFFADYQGQSTDRPGDATATVAPASWRNGSAFGIPASAIDPVAARILADTVNYPLPTNGNATGNYVHSADSTTKNNQFDVKLDANFGPNDNVFLRGSYGKYDTHQSEAVFPLAYGNKYLSNTNSFAFNWTHSISPTTVNEVRIGYSHVTNQDNPADPGNTGNYAEAVGLPIVQNIPGLPQFALGSGLDNIGTAGVGHDGTGNTSQISEKLSFSKGKHYVSVGGQFIHYNMQQLYSTNTGLLGFMNFDNFQAFLEGKASSKGALVSATAGSGVPTWTQLQNRIGVFVQDDYKPTSNLTLNLGLRWEYASPITEQDNHQVNYDVNTGAQILPGGAFGDALYNAYYGGFSPRLGFAYTVNPKTVLRGGFGLVQYQEGTGANCRLPINPPFEAEARGGPGALDNGFLELGTASDQNPAKLQLRAWQTDLRPQTTKQWNFFVERELTTSTSLNVGYVGSRSTHVITFNDDNAPLSNVSAGVGPRRLPQLGFIRYTASNGTINYDGLQASLRHRMAHGLEFLASYTFSKALSDNQGFYGPGWGGRSANNATAGTRGDGNYDPYNLGLDYGPEWFSATHTGSLSMNYQLPVGKGRSVGSDWSGVTQALLGGWNVSGILSVRSGLPITVVNGWGGGGPSNNTGFGFERPNVTGAAITTGAAKSDLETGARYLNPAAFVSNTTPGTHGNSGVGIARGPAFYNLDAGLDKNFDFGGSRYLTLRIEAFNVLNHTNLGLPNRDFNDPANFGTITEVANAQRVLELAAKFVF